jgi:predicted Zn finger-like uncharacterized protein
VVVTCEKCSTRFRLDESRIPPTGARVRCSRCKHAFLLPPPAGSGGDEAIHAIAAATIDGGPAPPASEDLGEVLAVEGAQEPRGGVEVEPATLDDEEESRWEFSETLRNDQSEERVAEPETPFERFGASGAAIGAPEAASASEDPGLGSPESWDLVGSPEARDAALAESLDLEQRGPAPEPEPLFTRERVATLPIAPIPVQSEPARRAAPAARGRRRVATAFAAVGWLVVAALVAVALEGVLFPPRAPAAAHALRAGGLTAHDLRGRFIENALAGPLFVVSAELRNASDAPQTPGEALRVVLFARDGSRVPAPAAWVAPVLDEGLLREASPEAIRGELERGARSLAATSVLPDASLPVAAVVEGVPAQAVRFALEEVAIAELPGEATDAGAAAAESDTGATEQASLPSLPSSPE